MPTDAELQALFREAAAPASRIDTAAVIRRSRRRRLPQQVGAGGVLTLAAAGIGVASISGLQGLRSPVNTAESADSWVGASENSPFGGREDAGAPQPSCSTGDAAAAAEAEVGGDLQAVTSFPAEAEAGQAVSGDIILTNTGAEPVIGTLLAPRVALTRSGVTLWHSDPEPAATTVQLEAGDSTTIPFTFDTGQCYSQLAGTAEPVEPGDYTLTAVVTLVGDDGRPTMIGGAASSISLR